MRCHFKRIIFTCLTAAIFVYFIKLAFKFPSFSEKRLDLPKQACGRLPQQQNIVIDNRIWQVFQLKNESYKLYSAYFDDRQGKTVVRVSMLGRELVKATDRIFCQLWFNESPDAAPFVVVASEYVKLWHSCEFSKPEALVQTFNRDNFQRISTMKS
jgi:hypothetical protein